MKLNLVGRENLRSEVGKKLEEIYTDIISNQKVMYQIKLPNSILEELLFEKQTDNNGITFKKFAFFSPRIDLLDLSELSFDNVDFRSKKFINLGCSNANIDLTKSYTYRDHCIAIRNCDLTQLNLGEYIDFSKEKEIVNIYTDNSDLSGNKIRFENVEFHCCDTNFTGNDLSGITVPLNELEISFVNCNLRNTGLNISIKEGKLDEKDAQKINEIKDESYFEGCYLGKGLLRSKEQEAELKSYLLSEYETWSEEYIDDVIISIDLQVNPCGGRIPEPTHIPEAPKQKGSKKFEASIASFYGCDDAPALPVKDVKKPKTKKLKRPDSNLGGFYGCDN